MTAKSPQSNQTREMYTFNFCFFLVVDSGVPSASRAQDRQRRDVREPGTRRIPAVDVAHLTHFSSDPDLVRPPNSQGNKLNAQPDSQPQGVPFSLDQAQSQAGNANSYSCSDPSQPTSRTSPNSCTSIDRRYGVYLRRQKQSRSLSFDSKSDFVFCPPPPLLPHPGVGSGFSRMASISSLFRSNRRSATPATPMASANSTPPAAGNQCK